MNRRFLMSVRSLQSYKKAGHTALPFLMMLTFCFRQECIMKYAFFMSARS